MNIPDLTDGFVAWQSTLPCRANQKTPFVDERVFQNRGVCGQAFPFLPSPPTSRTFLCSFQFLRVPKSEKCFKPAESPMETGSGRGGPDPVFPRLFHENPASRTFFDAIPNPVFSLPKKIH